MTMAMLAARGIDVDLAGYTLSVGPGPLRAVRPEAQSDWSAASFWYSIAAVTAGWVTLEGMTADRLQGDSVLCELGPRFGVLTEFTDEGAELSATPDIYSRLDLNMADWPDLVPPLAVTAYLAGMPFRFTGVENLRYKESDRLETLSRGLLACGCVTEQAPDCLAWEGARVPLTEIPVIDPRADHRIAMAFAAASVFIPGIIIKDTEAAAKSYPSFWDDLRAAGFTLTDASEPLPGPEHEA